MDMDNGVEIDCEIGGGVDGLGRVWQRGENWDNCNRITKKWNLNEYKKQNKTKQRVLELRDTTSVEEF